MPLHNFPAPPILSTYGTTLPLSPVDGQQALLTDSITAPTYQWWFRYNIFSTSPYKWEFVGGTPAEGRVLTNETRANNAYGDLATVGPTFTAPRAGEYRISFGFRGLPTTGDNCMVSIQVAAGTASDNDSAIVNAGAVTASVYRNLALVTAMAAGDVAKMVYRSTGGGSNGYMNRTISVWPVRVS